jgi:hypothetical protein
LSTLEEFAAAAAKPPCKVCVHPRLADIHAARLKGVSFRTMARWTAADPDGAPAVGETCIAEHFHKGHAARG